jgi:hypothetical protein
VAVAQASVLFFICLLGCSDWFYDGLMPDISLKSNSSITTKYDCNVKASGHRETNLLGLFWQIKNNTLAVPF